MQFTSRKRRQPPAVIIVSLIDVLLVVLIFLMVSTHFKKPSSVKLVLPESKQAKAGATERAKPTVVRVLPNGDLELDSRPMTADKIQQTLAELVQKNPQTTLFIEADTKAPFGQIVKIMDAAKAANLKTVSAYTKGDGK